MAIFIKRDRERPSLVKYFIKSKQTERDWNRNRWTRMRGIKEYHSSTEGKKHHRQLERMLITRVFVPKEGFLG